LKMIVGEYLPIIYLAKSIIHVSFNLNNTPALIETGGL
jgi:hypothetical protein